MSQPSFPQCPSPQVLYPNTVIRSRKEISTRDIINATQYEHWQHDSKQPSYNRINHNKRHQFYEFLPQSDRLDNRDYSRHESFNESKYPLEANPYFEKMNIADQERNIIREFRSSVHETKNKDNIDIVHKLNERNFNNIWFTQNNNTDQNYQGYQLRSIRDDYTKSYK